MIGDFVSSYKIMTRFNHILLYSWLWVAAAVFAVEPEKVYDGGYNDTDSRIELRIGNGGAGQSGLVEGIDPTHQPFNQAKPHPLQLSPTPSSNTRLKMVHLPSKQHGIRATPP